MDDKEEVRRLLDLGEVRWLVEGDPDCDVVVVGRRPVERLRASMVVMERLCCRDVEREKRIRSYLQSRPESPVCSLQVNDVVSLTVTIL